MVSLQNGRKQDFFVQGQVGEMHYLGVMDGHGGHDCINYVRTLDFDFIASQPDPALTLWQMVQDKEKLYRSGFYRSGCTFTFARITHIIEVWNVGDSLTTVYLNDKVFTSDIHTFLNPLEVERTKTLIERLEHTTAPHVASDIHIQDMPSIIGHFLTGDSLVPSQAYGHNGCTGFAPHKMTLHYKPTDRIRIVCVSDGVTDMKLDPDQLKYGSAIDIAKEAERKWNKPWIYQGHELKFDSGDDISCVIWENTIVEFPSLCIPYAPSVFTQLDVRDIFRDLFEDPYIRKIDEVLVKDHKVFFIHFNPGVLLPILRQVYQNLHEDKKVKIWVRERWFWNLRLSSTHIKKVGREYDAWDGTGDYYEFANEIHANTTSRIQQFLDEL